MKCTTLLLMVALAFAGIAVHAVRGADDEKQMTPAAATSDRSHEPFLPQLSLAKAVEYLDAGARAHEKDCCSCHGSLAYLSARPAIAAATPTHRAVHEAAEAFIAKLAETKADPKETPRLQISEAVVAAAVLAQHDAAAGNKLRPATRTALDRMWALQRDDGGWNWVEKKQPPSESDEHFGATMAAIAAGAAPGGYAQTLPAQTGIERVRVYLRQHPPVTLHQRCMLLLAHVAVGGLLTEEQSAQTIADLAARQRPDGGWSMAGLGDWKRADGGPLDATASDGYGTGFALCVLRRGGKIAAADPRLARGVQWLNTHQRVSGCWFTRSPYKNDELSTYEGTACAILALAACGATGDAHGARPD